MKKEESRLKGNKTAFIYSKLYICCMYVGNSKIVYRKYIRTSRFHLYIRYSSDRLETKKKKFNYFTLAPKKIEVIRHIPNKSIKH